MADTALFPQFQAALAALGGEAVLVHGMEQAADAVLAALRARGIREVVAWADRLLEQVGLPAAAERDSVRWLQARNGEFRDQAARAGAGITTANWAVAETGTLALIAGPGRPRITYLLPPLHVALVPAERLLEGTADLFPQLAGMAAAGGFPAAMNLVTGPSRSADIEDVLVRKVHGPGEVLVVVLA